MIAEMLRRSHESAPVLSVHRGGEVDILWRHKRTGDLHVWFMTGTQALGAAPLSPSRFADARWRISRVEDLNEEDFLDILWQNQETGDLLVWYMSGLVVVSRSHLTPRRLAEPSWKVAPR